VILLSIDLNDAIINISIITGKDRYRSRISLDLSSRNSVLVSKNLYPMGGYLRAKVFNKIPFKDEL
jgi:hypothetical protein